MEFEKVEGSDLVHASRKDALKRGTHSLGGNPGVPDELHKISAAEAFDRLEKRLEKYTGSRVTAGSARQLLMQVRTALGTLSHIEHGKEKRLEDLAVELVESLPEFKSLVDARNAGHVELRPKITADIDLSDIAKAPETEEEQDELVMELAAIDAEHSKRRLINSMIQGSAVSKNYAFEMVKSELDKIDPRLINLYGLLMAASEIGYWMFPDEMIRTSAGEVGIGKSRLEVKDGKTIIHAKGISFPVVVQELIKGIMELASYSGMPKDKATRDKILKTDFIDHETWDMILGPGLWKRYLDSMDLSDQELAINMWDLLVHKPTEEFAADIKVILKGGPEAKALAKKLIAQVKE